MQITLSGFSGIIPRLSPYALPKNSAQTALNTKLWAGVLEPINAAGSVSITGSLIGGTKKTLYRFGQGAPSDVQYWFSWTTEVGVCRSPIANDTQERTFFFGDGVPKFTDSTLATTGAPYPYASYSLKVPTPTSAPAAGISGAGDGVVEQRAYVCTFIRRFGGFDEESAPSPVVTCTPEGGEVVTLSSLPANPGGNYNVTHRAFYRTATGSEGTDYYYVGEHAVASTTFVDNYAGTDLGEAIPSLGWQEPPDTLVGLIPLPGGMMAAYTGKDVWVSEPFIPSAWHFLDTSDYPIVGLAPLGSGFLVLTKGYPYLANGNSPDSMFLQRLDIEQSCVSHRSISRFGNGVIYASPDGLVYVDLSGSRVLTEATLTHKEWNTLLTPSTLHGYVHDNRYYGFHSTGGFIFDPADNTGSFSTHDISADAGFVDPQTDALYIVSASTVYRWDTGAAKTFTWKSGPVQVPTETNFAWAQAVATTYSGVTLTFKLYVDTVLKHTETVSANSPFRLPSGFRGRFIEIELSGTAKVISVSLAHSAQELTNA